MTATDEARTVREKPEEVDISESVAAVSAHRSSPDRTVFVEDGNSDGWIATDLVVSLDF